MRVIAEMILHYGKEYMEKALQSIDPFVDKIVILYSPTASQGHPTDLVCPDTREELKAIADKFPKVEWVDCIEMGNEGQHRAAIFAYTDGYDVLMLCDSDEVYEPEDLPKVLEEVYNSPKRYHLVEGFIHFWKSHKWFLDDHFRPMRFINLNRKPEDGDTVVKCRIYHFSYCQSIEIIKYKLKVSGHFDEFRPEWLGIFETWTPENRLHKLHPTTYGVWEEAKEFTGKLPYGL